jgi:hypothetical protein
LTAEDIQHDQNHDDEEDDRENAASSATGLHYGRPLAVRIIAIIGHWKLSLFTLFLRNERTAYEAVPDQRGTMKSLGMLGLALLASCSPAHEAQQSKHSGGVGTASNNATDVTVLPTQAGNAAFPEDRGPLVESKGPIDPKSAEAAGQVVQHYGALIEQRRFEEAEKLWSDGAAASRLESQLAPYPEIHLEIGKPGEPGGAAGSIYVTVPVRFYGKDQSGAPLRVAAEVVLRRVNDVPGSTEAQRRWHIERIDWKKAG